MATYSVVRRTLAPTPLSKAAREVNRLTGWRGPVFERRYEMTIVTDEEAAQAERLKYVLANGVKENLVERVCEWPGVHSAESLIHGTPLQGHWFDRTQQYAARNQGEELRQDQYVFAESVTLSPIPCWADLPADRYRERIKSLVEQVDAEAARARRQSGASVLGAKAILAQNPLTRPDSVAHSPAPLVHAATKAARKMFYAIYAEFVSAFRAAAEALRQGHRDASFPAGSFPPALPFVPS
jgi:hypothetical protein